MLGASCGADADRKGTADFKKDCWGGLTATVAYTMLATGEDPGNNPKLKEAIDFLLKEKLVGPYAVGMRTQVWLNAYKYRKLDAYKTAAKADGKFLGDLVKLSPKSAASIGLYNYVLGPGGACAPITVAATTASLGSGPVRCWTSSLRSWRMGRPIGR